MNPLLGSLADRAAPLLWSASLCFGLLGAALLVPIAIWRRRPAVRHFVALAALIGALAAPIAAACSLRWGLDWAPIPEVIRLAAAPDDAPPAEVPPAPSAAPVATPEHAFAPAGPALPGRVRGPAIEVADAPSAPPRPAEEPVALEEPRRDAEDLPATAPPVRVEGPIATRDAAADGGEIAATAEAPAPAGAWSVRDALRMGVYAWVAGLLAITALGLGARIRLRKLVRESRAVDDPRAAGLVGRAASAMGIARAPALLASSRVTNPFVAGASGPRIVVPESLLAPGEEEALMHVLLHECGHIARGDLRIGRIRWWARALHWPNPLVHVHGAILARAREELCDNRVLQCASPASYARTLLALGERASGLSPAAMGLFGRRFSLVERIGGLLDARRDRSVGLGRLSRLLLGALALVLATASAGIGRPKPAGDDPPAAAKADAPPAAAGEVPDAREIVRKLAERSASWVAPPEGIETLEYDFVSRGEVTPIKVKRGERRRPGVWTGTTLRGGVHELVRSPDDFDVRVERKEGAKALLLRIKVKEGREPFRVEAGNGVEDSWRGYFSGGAREAEIVVDAERFLPTEERTGSVTIRYSEWREVGGGRWVPLRVDVLGSSSHYRMHFAWVGDAAWLLQRSESIAPEGTVVLTHIRNPKIDGKPFEMPAVQADRGRREAAAEFLAMLDRNRPWLDGGPAGVGWKPPFRLLSYTFRTIREDVTESCALDNTGEVAVEVSADGSGKMKDRVGSRRAALNPEENTSSRRGARFARIFTRKDGERGQEPYDLALKHYARIGCQFDLPLFRYRDRPDSVAVEVADGEWMGHPCRVATVTDFPARVYLGSGTMFAFTSWSYVHHIGPSKEVIYIDPARGVPIHETLVSGRDEKAFEIDFGDYVEVEPGQWAPRSIRIESEGYFTCEYRFQLVAETHWMLREVVSWFDPKDKSRGVVEGIRVDKGAGLLDEARGQAKAAKDLFGGVGEPDRRLDVATAPFSLGSPIRSGPYELKVSTTANAWQVVVSASTADPEAPGRVPICFLDEKQRLLFSVPVTLGEPKEGVRGGAAELYGSPLWQSVRSVVVPAGDAETAKQPLRVLPFRWGEEFAVNIPDSLEGSESDDRGKAPRDARTRAFQARIDRAGDGAAKLTLDVVSIDGPRKFNLNLAAALLDDSGRLISCGGLATTLMVVSEPVEQRFEIDLGRVPAGSEPKFVAIGISPGSVIGAPMGSTWGAFFGHEPAFEAAALLAAPDEDCWRAGLAELGSRTFDEAIEEEAFEDRQHEGRMGDGPYSRRTLLKPHREALARILAGTKSADVRAAAARFLAYSEADGAADALAKWADDPDGKVRDAVAIGLTFLGRPEHLGRVRSILGRKAPVVSKQPGAGYEETRAHNWLMKDALFALAHQHSDASVDVLGESLLADLGALRVAANPEKEPSAERPSSQASMICKALARTGNPRSARWLLAADDLIEEGPDVSKYFERGDLAWAMLQFKEQTKDRIIAKLEGGSPDELGTWLYYVRDSRGPEFLGAIGAMFRREGISSGAVYYGTSYLWNTDSPEAVEILRGAYDRRLGRDNPRTWFRLCEALAAKGDGRGLADAFDALVDLEWPAQPPADQKRREQFDKAREDRRRMAQEVFDQSPKPIIAEFLAGKVQAAAPEERRVVLQLLWKLPELPEGFATTLPKWAEGGDKQVAEQAKRLLDRG